MTVDRELEEALGMTREELHRKATEGTPVEVAKVRPAWMDKDDLDLTEKDLDEMFAAGRLVKVDARNVQIRIVP